MNRSLALRAAGISVLLAGSMLTLGAGQAAATSTSCNAAPVQKDFSAKFTNASATAAQVSYVGSQPLCSTQTISFNAYLTDGPSWSTSGKQVLVDHQTVQLSSSKTSATMAVELPANCYFQTDVYLGSQRFDGTTGNGPIPKYPATDMSKVLLIARNAGTEKCAAPTPTPKPTATPTPTPTATPTVTPTPVVTPTPTPTGGQGQVLGVTTLPDTGAGLVMTALGTSSMIGMAAAYIRSRRK